MRLICINIIRILLVVTVLTSCEKEQTIGETSSLTILNCMTDGSYLFPALSNSPNLSFSDKNKGISPLNGVVTGFTKEAGLPAGNVPLKIYIFPDSIKPAVAKTYDLKPRGIYSLFVTGAVTAPDTLFTKDEIPFAAPQDSLIIVRFVNLVQGGPPLSVTLADKPGIPQMQNLAYKSITKFQTFSVKKAVYNSDFYYFEVRNALTQDIISTFNYQWRFVDNKGGGSHYMSKAATGIIVNYMGKPTCTIIPPSRTY